ncbi:MAG: endolytic transglycosylase MltG [Pseudomonadota bacterium]
MVKHIVANFLTLLFLGLLVVAGLILVSIDRFSAPGPLSEATLVSISEGASLNSASETLVEAGAIESATLFRLGARYSGAQASLKFGDYEIPAAASMQDVLDIVTSGRSVQYKVTVPEGLTSWEVVQILNENEYLTGEVDAVPAEGSLAPDTYFVSRGSSRLAVLARMQAAQKAILEEAWARRAGDTPLATPEEALVLASIIEKETGVASERAKVGGVFVNRLRLGMKLQSDPTIIYGITNGEGPLDRPIRRSDISRPTAYNTYVIDRLPPGPIANPGREAIFAAVAPDETEALYFVADGTGGHAFASTLRDHQKNVAVWREIERARQSE